MSEDFGNGVSRTLTAIARQFQAVVFQEGKPPLDSELNLVQQNAVEQLAQLVRAEAHSGFFSDPTRALDDFVTSSLDSNRFELGQQKFDDTGAPEELDPILYANVNGYVIPVSGTLLNLAGSTSNEVRLNPPPESGSRIDFVFLEAWTCNVAPNPSTANKPAADSVWKFGNTKFGGTNLTDDIIDPTIAFETTERVQLQYAIRVFGSGTGAGSSPDLEVYPDGLGDPNVFAQGPNSAVSTFTFENARTSLGDPSLWRAGDGNPTNALNTTDGYVYAIPICAIFRRNNQPFVAASLAGAGNQNGSFDRNPSAATLPTPSDGAKVLTTMSLINDMPASQFAVDTTIEVDNLIGSGWDDPNIDFTTAFMVIDNEVIGISAVDTTASPNTITVPAGGRGRWGSDIVLHGGRTDPATAGTGTAVAFYNTRPDGLFADEIAPTDILDLRRAVNLGDWDYDRLLLHNVSALIRNQLRSTWKQDGAGGNTQGVRVTEVDYLLQDGGTAVPVGTEALDGPDGIRQVWSDAAAIQGDVTMLLNPAASMNDGFIQTLDDAVNWDVGADFKPAAFMNNLNNATPGFTNGSTIFVYIGGDDGTNGARKTFRDGSTRAVRFVSPREYWKTLSPNSNTGLQNPVSLLWTSSDNANTSDPLAGAGLQALSPAGPGEPLAEHPGAMYPLQSLNFEKPFLVCGGVLNSSSVVTGLSIAGADFIGNSVDPTIPLGEGEIVLTGLDFDTSGVWWSAKANGEFANDPSAISQSVIRGERTLWDLLTNGGQDITGNSSEVYVVLFGDETTTAMNGAFQVIGAGTAAANGGLTTSVAGANNRIRVKFLSEGVTDFDAGSTGTLTAELRSPITNSEDGNGSAGGPAALTVTLTDVEAMTGGSANPWNATNINSGGAPGRSLTQPFDFKCLMNLTLMYHPGRGGAARVPDEISRIALQSPNSSILRQSKANLDPAFATATGSPSSPAEVNYCPTHVQTWNRLPSLGLYAPDAPDYGGNVVLSSEIDRENESFFDNGSKTLVFRPFQRKLMTTKGVTIEPPASSVPPLNVPTLLGEPTTTNPENQDNYPNPALILNGYTGPKDDAQLFTVGLRMGYPVPHQYMPRFGRQDIPYFQDAGPAFGSGNFLEGINHLFLDSTDPTNPVFNIIGGEDNMTGGALITPMYVQTGASSGLAYGQFASIGGLKNGYQGRLVSDIGTGCPQAAEITGKLANVVSSDFGAGLNGIQLPPYLGVARLYGVYDRRDFIAKGGATYQADRVTPEADPATNLLRRDETKQTLFICEDGAFDLTEVRGDHTYIVPFSAIDITKSPNFTAGEVPNDLEYVLEFTCFGFSHGWINENNYVMARRHNAQGTLFSDNNNPELDGMLMAIPAAAPDSQRLYMSYERTVYQGDPYMSRAGATRTVSDYENRYGQISQSDAFELQTAIQQFDSDGNAIPERINTRSFEVLAALDFYTTMGTGNMGGRLFPGTVTDAGVVDPAVGPASRLPETITQPAWRVLTRAFSEGQAKINTDRAQAVLEVTGTNATFFPAPALGSVVTIYTADGTAYSFTAVNGPTVNDNEFDASSPDATVIARELFTKINARVELATVVRAFNDLDSPEIQLVSFEVGSAGNAVRVEINDTTNLLLKVPTTGEQGITAQLTTTNLQGGDDILINAGDGTTQLSLTGMTERLPLGILLQDSDFIGENPLNDRSSAVQTIVGGIRPVQSLLPLTASAGAEYTRFSGAPGQLLAQSDGAILQYQAFTDTTPGGSKSFRLFRGGGSGLVLSGDYPGGPVEWFSDSLPGSSMPVLKGGLLACKALLVRNFSETAFATEDTTTDGDEIQMVVLTEGLISNQPAMSPKNKITIGGIVSPTGFGEGYSATDRYRINGKPMFVGRVRTTVDPDAVPMAPYPGRENEDN